MIKIRLARYGSKNKPYYKVIAIDERKKRNGKPVELIGFWQPSKKVIKIDEAKVKAWVAKGAVVTAAVTKLLTH